MAIELESHLTELFLNNEYTKPKNTTKISVYNPASGDLVSDQIPVVGQEDIDYAVQTAKDAFKPGSPWTSMTGQQRQSILLKFADILENNEEYLSRLTRLTLGAPRFPFGQSEVKTAITCFRYYAGWTDKQSGQHFPADDGFYKVVHNEPLGVVAGIIPWNGPMASMGLKAAPALATGNVFILKPSEKTPLAAAALGKLILEAGFPPGVFQVLAGDGTTGALLASHMEVAKVSFTGSVPTGKAVQVLAAKSNLKRVTLELGGKSPAVVFDDANLENAVDWTVNALTTNTGQICFAATRIYVQAGIYDRFIEAYTQALREKQQLLGDPEEEGIQIGPVVDKAQYERVLGFINAAQNEKQGTLVVGGSKCGSKAYFIQPTLFANTAENASIYKDEIFGPVAVINKFETEKEVVDRSNSSIYGLMAGVFTQDVNRALRMATGFDSGVVGVNCISLIHCSAPFGGTKQSGVGREMGEHALRAFTEPKTVLINLKY